MPTTLLLLGADEVSRSEFWMAVSAVVTLTAATFAIVARSGWIARGVVASIEALVHRLGKLESDHTAHLAETAELAQKVTIVETRMEERTGPHRPAH